MTGGNALPPVLHTIIYVPPVPYLRCSFCYRVAWPRSRCRRPTRF